jgi:hypothetical protein
MAEEELAADGVRATASRLSLLTGLHRKDIRRLHEELPFTYDPPTSVSLGARLVACWTGSPEYLDEEGRPLPLSRVASPGGEPSFEGLVGSVSTDIRARAVLEEWMRLGVVQVDADDRVRLRIDAFVPSKGFDEKAHYFGRNLHDHIAAGAHNLGGDEPPLLDRSVYYDGLGPESVAELAQLSERLGMDALRAVNRRALALKKRGAEPGDPHLRMNFGIYFYRAQTGRGQGEEEREDG